MHWTNLQACYARQPDVSADCIKDVPGNPWTTVRTTTTAGLYIPVYYVLVEWPSIIFQDSSGVFAMRFVSASWRRFFLPSAS